MARLSVRISFGLLLAAFLAAQLVRPPAAEPARSPNARTIWQDAAVPPEVASILRRSCADCHSLQTSWPGYAHVAPVSWMISSDVRRARENLDLSDWPAEPDLEKGQIGDVVTNHLMPPKRYLVMHPGARLSDAQARAILRWIQSDPK